jgi:DNA-binding MarR family transcriptional regulator
MLTEKLSEKLGGDIGPAVSHAGEPAPDRDTLRLWLRLLSVTMIAEKRVRAMLAAEFGSTLPRFDILAALERAAQEDEAGGLGMSQLSRALLVSNGNITALVQALARDGLVEVLPSPTDRRATIVRLTPEGADSFRAQAARHHALVTRLFAGLDPGARTALYQQLGQLRASLAAAGDQP